MATATTQTPADELWSNLSDGDVVVLHFDHRNMGGDAILVEVECEEERTVTEIGTDRRLRVEGRGPFRDRISQLVDRDRGVVAGFHVEATPAEEYAA